MSGPNPKLMQAIARKYVEWLPIQAEDGVVSPILATACASIRASRDQTDKLIAAMDEDRAEMGDATELADEHDALTEELLGAAFVVLQRRMTAFSSRVMHVSDLVAKHYAIAPPFTAKHKVFAFGKLTGAGHSAGVVINAFANYYKHRDEPDFWTSPKHQAAPIVGCYGLSAKTETENMRRAAQVLGASPNDLDPLLDALAEWSREVTNEMLGQIGAPLIK